MARPKPRPDAKEKSRAQDLASIHESMGGILLPALRRGTLRARAAELAKVVK